MKIDVFSGAVEVERWFTGNGPDELSLYDASGNSAYFRPDSLEDIRFLFDVSSGNKYYQNNKASIRTFWNDRGLTLFSGDSYGKLTTVLTLDEAQQIISFIDDTKSK